MKNDSTTTIDIVHVSTDLFRLNLLTYLNMAALAKPLQSLLKGQTFPAKDGSVYRITGVQARGNTIKMMVEPVKVEASIEEEVEV